VTVPLLCRSFLVWCNWICQSFSYLLGYWSSIQKFTAYTYMFQCFSSSLL
jgi:hypothetical protein